MHISYVLETLIQFCLISLVSTHACMHNDTRDWQAYRNRFLNSVLVFSSAKNKNRAHTDVANVNARIQGKMAIPPTCVLFALCADQTDCVAHPFDFSCASTTFANLRFDRFVHRNWILAKRSCVLPRFTSHITLAYE